MLDNDDYKRSPPYLQPDTAEEVAARDCARRLIARHYTDGNGRLTLRLGEGGDFERFVSNKWAPYEKGLRDSVRIFCERPENGGYDPDDLLAGFVHVANGEDGRQVLYAGEDERPEGDHSGLAGAVLDAATLATTPPPEREWLVEGFVPRSDVTLLTGDGGLGKGRLALQLSIASAVGGDWIGRPVATGDALFVTAEDDAAELHRRVASIATAAGVSSAIGQGSHLKLLSLAGTDIDPVLAEPDSGGKMKPTATWHELLRVIDDLRPAFVVLDPSSHLFGGNENNRAQVRAFVAMLRAAAMQYETAIILISHPSQAGLTAGAAGRLNASAGSSGSTAWSNSVRSRLYLSRAEGKQGRVDPDLRVLTVMKANYAQSGVQVRLRWSNGMLVPEDALSIEDAAEAEAAAERVFLDMLATCNSQGRRVGASPSKNYAPAVFAEQTAKFDKYELADAMKRLFEKRAIAIATEGPPSKRVERLVIAGDDAAEKEAA